MKLTINGFDFVEQKNNFWISGIDICRKLGYEFPRSQATKIWNRHKKYLDNYSVVAKLASTDSKKYDTRIYNEAGSRFFISKCNMPKADEITIAMIQGFIQLRDEVSTKREHRKKGRLLFRGLTEQLSQLKEDESSNSGDYIYLNMARNNCQVVTGMSPRQLRHQRGVKDTRDGLTLSESVKLATLELYQANRLKRASMTPKEAYMDLKAFSERFIDALKQIE